MYQKLRKPMTFLANSIGSTKGFGKVTRCWWNSFYLGSIPIETQKKIPDTQIMLLVKIENLEKKQTVHILCRHRCRHTVTTSVTTRAKVFLKPRSQREKVTRTFSFVDSRNLYTILFPFFKKKKCITYLPPFWQHFLLWRHSNYTFPKMRSKKIYLAEN